MSFSLLIFEAVNKIHKETFGNEFTYFKTLRSFAEFVFMASLSDFVAWTMISSCFKVIFLAIK